MSWKCHFFVYFPRYTTPRKEIAPTPPQRKIIEERTVTREMTPPVEAAPSSGPREPKQRITQEELTIEEVRKQEGAPAGAYSRPPPSNEYRYQEEMLPPPDEYHFEEKRTEMVAVPPEAMDSRKSESTAMLLKGLRHGIRVFLTIDKIALKLKAT